MHSRPTPSSLVSVSHAVQSCWNSQHMFGKNERRGQTVMLCFTVLASFTYVWSVARSGWLGNSPHCYTTLHFKYFILFIIQQLWKIRSTMVVIWERGKEFCGVLHVDSDVYAALIPKVQIVTCTRREMETDVLDIGIQGKTMRWWNRFKCYPVVWLLLDQQAEGKKKDNPFAFL